MGRGLYVETLVRGDLDRLWHLSQDAAAHTRWDLRFGLIEDLTATVGGGARAFRYSSGAGPVRIWGTGTTVGEHRRADGTRTSALRFASDHPLSPIRRGSGWWRYVPTGPGVRFLTGYDYTPSWGVAGAAVDRVLLRPLMGWATAWSFDRLRRWVEDGISPEQQLARAVADAGLRVAALTLGLRALRTGRAGRGAFLVLLSAVPLVPGAPRAARCLRRPPDLTGRTAPTTLATLPEPA
ncbi:hypothetical protein [Aquipuribacter sp. MA13-6]|uniref:hypothetical protein n=1 Tax=unclassified Aquipuribacter TaxID=2635084 RepID=UPI003EEBB697